MAVSTASSTPQATNQDGKKLYMQGTDFWTLPDGSTYHLGTKRGEVEQRILTVGSIPRARKIAENCFDDGKIEFEVVSSRLMGTFNGKFNGVPVSVIAIGMGSPMMDFMIREADYCQPEPIACIRFGTCGILNLEDTPGTILTADKGSVYSYVNYGKQAGGHWKGSDSDIKSPYFLSKPIMGTPELNELMKAALVKNKLKTTPGLNACAETFYACQGRKNDSFHDDGCTDIVNELQEMGVDFMEMETHQLFSLGMRRKVPLYTASCAVGIVSRKKGMNVTAEDLNRLEVEGGRSCLEALVNFDFGKHAEKSA